MAEERKRCGMLTAHAGFAAAGGIEDRSEDNTLDNLIRTIRRGPDAVEADIRMARTAKGAVPILSHDQVCGPESAVRLEEIFALLRGEHPRSGEAGPNAAQVKIQLDLKEDGIAGELIDAVRGSGFPMERVIIAGDSSYETVQRERRKITEAMEEGLEFWLNAGCAAPYEELVRQPERFIARIKTLELPAYVVNTAWQAMPPERIDALKAEGVEVSVWTLNTRELLERYLFTGAHNVTSRNPLALELRKG